MVQEFNVVRCFSCETFQVEQVKKSTNKWNCKVCNEKQSLKQIFFNGTGKECRVNCQSLNMKRHSKDAEINQVFANTSVEEICAVTDNICNTTFERANHGNDQPNKWAHFLEEKQEVEDDAEENESSSLLVQFRGEKTTNNTRKRKQAPKRNYCEKSMKFGTSNPCDTEQYSDENTFTNDKYMNTQVHQASVSRTPSHPDKFHPLKESEEYCYVENVNNNAPCDDVETRTFGNHQIVKDCSTNKSKELLNCTKRKIVNRDSKNLSVDSKWTKFLSVEEEELSDDGII